VYANVRIAQPRQVADLIRANQTVPHVVTEPWLHLPAAR
jgi:hypothetical protein